MRDIIVMSRIVKNKNDRIFGRLILFGVQLCYKNKSNFSKDKNRAENRIYGGYIRTSPFSPSSEALDERIWSISFLINSTV